MAQSVYLFRTQEYMLTSTYSPSPLTGEGWGEGVKVRFVSPSPQSPPTKGGEFLRFFIFNVYFGAT